jgi:hypothetical protein
MSNWTMALNIDYNDTKGNFTGFTWYKDGVAQNGTPTAGNSCQVGDSINWCVSAANLPSGVTLSRFVFAIGKFQGHNDGTKGSPFNMGNSTTGSAQCWYEQTSSTPWSTPVTGYQGFATALPVQQDPGAKGHRSKYEFMLVAIYSDSSGNSRQFGCDPEIDVDNGN